MKVQPPISLPLPSQNILLLQHCAIYPSSKAVVRRNPASPSMMLLRQELQVDPLEISDATDKIILPQSFLDLIIRTQGNDDLPDPITFRIKAHNRETHVGVREFSSAEGNVVLPSVVMDNLAAKAGSLVQISLANLPKGESVKLRPLAGGYDLNQDWKVALESAFRSSYTTLTKGDVIRLKSGVRFLVDALSPADAVCIVNTDLEVDLEPLSEDQALETMKATASMGTLNQTVSITIDVPLQGNTEIHNQIVLEQWRRDLPIYIDLESSDPDADLLVSTDSDEPSMRAAVWSNLNSTASKTIEIQPTNTYIESAKSLRIAVHADTATRYSLAIKQTRSSEPDTTDTIGPNETRCLNCLVAVPTRSLMLHERHCLKYNKPCPEPDCQFVFKQGLDESHWHCPTCRDPGSGSLTRHSRNFHPPSPLTCPDCSTPHDSLPRLLLHRATSCPARLSICRFCQLRLPQGDSSGLGYSDLSHGLSAHEAECGSRTTECDICRRLIRLKDVSAHMKFHDGQRLSTRAPVICSNNLCVHQFVADQVTYAPDDRGGSITGRDSLGLCRDCFGPLYSTLHDPTGSQLRARLTRRYATQLVSGCRRIGCRNPNCATCTGNKVNYATALARIAAIRGVSAAAGGTADGAGGVGRGGGEWICVGDAVQRKRAVAERLACEDEYAIEWCCRASDETSGDFDDARRWLTLHAIKRSES